MAVKAQLQVMELERNLKDRQNEIRIDRAGYTFSVSSLLPVVCDPFHTTNFSELCLDQSGLFLAFVSHV